MAITVLPDRPTKVHVAQSPPAPGAALAMAGAVSLLAGLVLGVDEHNWLPHSAWIMAGAALLCLGLSRSEGVGKRARSLCTFAAVAMALLGVYALCRWVL